MHVIENFSLADFLHCCVMNYCAGDVVCSESGQAFIHVNGIYLLGLNLIEPQCFTSYCNNIDIVKPIILQLLIESSYMDWPKEARPDLHRPQH